MSEISEILNSPIASDEDIKRSLIMTVFTMLFFLIIPLFILAGYYARAANHQGEGLPPIGSYMKLFVTGIKVTAGKPLFIAPLLILIAAEAFISELLMIVLILLLTIPIFYVPAMVVGIGKEGSFREGFSRRTIRRSLSMDYFVAWLAVFAAGAIMSVVKMALIITLIGILLLPAAHVYEKLLKWRLFGYFLDLERLDS